MMQTLNKMKEKLERESTEHKNVKQQAAELTARLHELSTVRSPYIHWVTQQSDHWVHIRGKKAVYHHPTVRRRCSRSKAEMQK